MMRLSLVGRLARKLVTPPIRHLAFYTFVLPAMLATALYTASFWASDLRLLNDIANQAQDARAKLYANSILASSEARPIWLFHYDEAAMAKLGDPVLVPPTAIAKSFHTLARIKPWAVVVDLDLAYVTEPADVTALEAGLTALADEGVAVFLSRPILRDLEKGQGRLRPTRLDGLVARRPELSWISAGYGPSSDGVIRRLPPVQAARLGQACVVLPSAPLALLLLRKAGEPALAKAAFARGAPREATCKVDPRPAANFPYASRASLPIRPDDGYVNYTMGWNPDRVAPRIGSGQVERSQIWSTSMRYLTSAEEGIDPSRLRDGLIFLGRTSDHVDFHQTPLDEMPGVLILANGVRAWLDFGPQRPAFWPGLILVLVGALCVSLIAMLILMRVKRHRWTIKLLLPPVLSSCLWLLLNAAPGGGASAGLAIGAYIILVAVELGLERVEHLSTRGGQV